MSTDDDDGSHAFLVWGLLVSWSLMGLSYTALMYARYLEYRISKQVAPKPSLTSSSSSTQIDDDSGSTAESDAIAADMAGDGSIDMNLHPGQESPNESAPFVHV
ncbi:Aste57867_12847 [Aphanomyces stellatus]|uniref:Aste57867_12847 protein n=1 Tax=Aphanomyces stellatus TaxID=120398 RepID=A0A485KWM4_9STRA|nr:hypothetical protein As57867_012799 [Aphanomyces stellatus]VFT89694.1 Aste57867_12847 [Aphanomyces stellatus]